jgi:ubiquinone/menaquinone biosynthesis C-methylase UbiE
LPVADNSCDTVIATFVLCSVQDQSKVLAELLRVLKPGGKYIFIEHVAAPRGSFLRLYQNFINPLNRLWAKNCHVNRETLNAIKSAGFINIDSESENIKMIAVPWPHIKGVAQKPSAS